ncbi:MAG: hypothetical protein WBX81_08205, partial [Nitrososphaeraceae archaeon]
KTSSDLTDDQKERINEIITVCVAKIFYLVKIFNNPKDYAKEIRKFSRSRKSFFLFTFSFEAKNVTSDQFFFPETVKQIPYNTREVTGGILELVKKRATYLKSWEVQEALRELVKNGLLLNIKGKKKIKGLAPELFPRLLKGGGSDIKKREGFYSVYRITDDFAYLNNSINEVISNPKALEIIYSKLEYFGVLEEFYDLLSLALLHVLMEEGERTLEWATAASQAVVNNNAAPELLLGKYGLDTKEISFSFIQWHNYNLNKSVHW